MAQPCTLDAVSSSLGLPPLLAINAITQRHDWSVRGCAVVRTSYRVCSLAHRLLYMFRMLKEYGGVEHTLYSLHL